MGARNSKTAVGKPGSERRAALARDARRRRRWPILSIAAVFLLLVAAGGWLVWRALETKSSLERAQSLISQLQDQVTGDRSAMPETISEIRDRTEVARASSSDPLWRVAEAVPVLGSNLTAVRELAEVVDDVADGALPPLERLAATLDPASLKPVEGRIDVDVFVEAEAAIGSAEDVLVAASDKVDGIDAEDAIGQVRDAREKLASLLGTGTSLIGSVRDVARLVPGMLGADGPRNYLLMFQNNAEARALGGNPAALVLLTVDDGAISLSRQASSGDFPRDTGLTPDPGVYSAYYPHFPAYIMEITTRPDFPTAASLAKAYWEKYLGGTIDGVVSFDPVALGYLLQATGPLELPTGDQLTSDNAVPLLLSEVYARYPDPKDQDTFFAVAAAEAFSALTSGNTDAAVLLPALQKAMGERRLLFWSSNADEQAIVATTPVSGALPASNEENTTVGAYFMDRSVSKMDYYLDTGVATQSDLCTTDAPSFTMSVTLTAALDAATAAKLPSYVASGYLPRGQIMTDAYLLGPVGASVEAIDSPDAVVAQGTDLGRPVVGLSALLKPGESRTFNVVFRGAPDQSYGALQTVTTPMVRPTVVSQSTPGC